MALALLVLASGCAERSAVPDAPAAQGMTAKPGSALAYAHSVRIDLAAASIAERVQATRAACTNEEFGACSILELDSIAGDHPSGRLVVRIEPAGVEPLVALASAGGKIGSQTTSAEDLAEDIAHTGQQKERLELQLAKLLEFQARKDLTVADMLTLSRELALVESQLAEQARNGANQQRRIESNLLTIQFWAPTSDSSWSRVAGVWAELSDSLADATADALETVIYGLPFVIVWFPLLLLLRLVWRRFVQPTKGSPGP